MTTPTNILSIDLEDWYQGIEKPASQWRGMESRIDAATDTLLSILERAGTQATFFVLGQIAEDHADLIRRIAGAGHEIGTHGHQHKKVYDMSAAEFTADLQRSIDALEAASGQVVRGHRAAFFSITQQSLWALPLIQQAGLAYDASIYPGANYRYGIPNFRRDFHRTPNGLMICPMSTFGLAGRRLGVGGAYLRILPRAVTAWGIRQINRTHQPAVLYLHPWELDPNHPRVRFRRRAMLTHYANLRSTAPKLRALLDEFTFASYAEVLGLGATPTA